MATATVRPATDDDVDAIVGIQDRTWRTAYAGLLPEEAFASLTSDAARQHWTDAVHAGDDFHLLVAVADPGALRDLVLEHVTVHPVVRSTETQLVFERRKGRGVL